MYQSGKNSPQFPRWVASPLQRSRPRFFQHCTGRTWWLRNMNSFGTMVLSINIVLIGHLRHLSSSPAHHQIQSLTHMVRPYQEVEGTSEHRHKSMNARRAPHQVLSERRTFNVAFMMSLAWWAVGCKSFAKLAVTRFIYFEETCHKRSQSTSRPLALFLVWDDPANWSIISANIPSYILFLVWKRLEQKQFFWQIGKSWKASCFQGK